MSDGRKLFWRSSNQIIRLSLTASFISISPARRQKYKPRKNMRRNSRIWRQSIRKKLSGFWKLNLMTRGTKSSFNNARELRCTSFRKNISAILWKVNFLKWTWSTSNLRFATWFLFKCLTTIKIISLEGISTPTKSTFIWKNSKKFWTMGKFQMRRRQRVLTGKYLF